MLKNNSQGPQRVRMAKMWLELAPKLALKVLNNFRLCLVTGFFYKYEQISTISKVAEGEGRR